MRYDPYMFGGGEECEPQEGDPRLAEAREALRRADLSPRRRLALGAELLWRAYLLQDGWGGDVRHEVEMLLGRVMHEGTLQRTIQKSDEAQAADLCRQMEQFLEGYACQVQRKRNAG